MTTSSYERAHKHFQIRAFLVLSMVFFVLGVVGLLVGNPFTVVLALAGYPIHAFEEWREHRRREG